MHNVLNPYFEYSSNFLFAVAKNGYDPSRSQSLALIMLSAPLINNFIRPLCRIITDILFLSLSNSNNFNNSNLYSEPKIST